MELPQVDKNEAPDGFYAVRKPESVHGITPNICTFCDWRKQCNDKETDFSLSKHRCMAYAVVTRTGKEIRRQDGCSVIFKKIEG